MKAIVYEEICIGCALCTMTCPEVFKMEDGKAVPYTNPIPANSLEACKQAASECPVEAIKIEG
jgi:ferredoxin